MLLKSSFVHLNLLLKLKTAAMILHCNESKCLVELKFNDNNKYFEGLILPQDKSIIISNFQIFHYSLLLSHLSHLSFFSILISLFYS